MRFEAHSHSRMGLRRLVACACRVVLNRVCAFGSGIGALADGIGMQRQVVVRLSEAGMLLRVGWGLGLGLGPELGRGLVRVRVLAYLKVR